MQTKSVLGVLDLSEVAPCTRGPEWAYPWYSGYRAIGISGVATLGEYNC